MLVQWTSKMCPFHIKKKFGDRYTLSKMNIGKLWGDDTDSPIGTAYMRFINVL